VQSAKELRAYSLERVGFRFFRPFGGGGVFKNFFNTSSAFNGKSEIGFSFVVFFVPVFFSMLLS